MDCSSTYNLVCIDEVTQGMWRCYHNLLTEGMNETYTIKNNVSYLINGKCGCNRDSKIGSTCDTVDVITIYIAAFRLVIIAAYFYVFKRNLDIIIQAVRAKSFTGNSMNFTIVIITLECGLYFVSYILRFINGLFFFDGYILWLVLMLLNFGWILILNIAMFFAVSLSDVARMPFFKVSAEELKTLKRLKFGIVSLCAVFAVISMTQYTSEYGFIFMSASSLAIAFAFLRLYYLAAKYILRQVVPGIVSSGNESEMLLRGFVDKLNLLRGRVLFVAPFAGVSTVLFINNVKLYMSSDSTRFLAANLEFAAYISPAMICFSLSEFLHVSLQRVIDSKNKKVAVTGTADKSKSLNLFATTHATATH